MQRLDLVAGDAGGAQRLIRRVEQQLRRRVAAKVLAHPAMDGGRGLAVQLLVEDRLQQRLEGRRRGIEPERERAGAVDQRAQFGVGGAQMRQRLGGIKGKFAAAAVMNHRETVYRAGSSFRRQGDVCSITAPRRPRPCSIQWQRRTRSANAMKMRPGTQTGFLLCGKEWIDGEALEVRSPWDQGLVGRVTVATRADARQAVNHAVASLRRTRALPRWKRREILEDVAAALIEQKERFAQLIVAEAGKPVRLARAEVDRAVLTFKTAAEEAARLGGESHSAGPDRGQRRPLGAGAALSGGAGAGDYALQLSAEPGGAQGGARHGRRLPGDSEARAADAVYRAGAGRSDSEGRLARRGAGRAAAEQCRHRMAGGKGRSHQAGQLYRLGQSGLGAEGALRPQARAAGAGRQCRADRPRRLARSGRSGRCAPRMRPSATRASPASACSASLSSAASSRPFCGRWSRHAAKLVVRRPVR